jgi:hypothetical protein
MTHLKRHINDKHLQTEKFYCTQAGCSYSRQGGRSFPRKANWTRNMAKVHRLSPEEVANEAVKARLLGEEE